MSIKIKFFTAFLKQQVKPNDDNQHILQYSLHHLQSYSESMKNKHAFFKESSFVSSDSRAIVKSVNSAYACRIAFVIQM